MFDFLDGGARSTAQNILERAKTIERKYFPLPFDELKSALETDFPEPLRFMDERSTTMRYADLPEFAFYIIRNNDGSGLTAVGFAQFAGFSLQRTGTGWMTSVEDGIAHKATRKAFRLAKAMKSQGVVSFQDLMARR